MYGRNYKCTQNFVWDCSKEETLGRLGINEKIILNFVLERDWV
jgi:hypothetical protein